MFEVDEASRMITESCDQNANIIFGTSIDDAFTGEIKITVIATGFSEETNAQIATTNRGGFGQSRIFGGVPPVGNKTISQSSVTQPSHTAASTANSYEEPAYTRNPAPSTNTHTARPNPVSNFGHNNQSSQNTQSDVEIPAFLRNRMGR